MRSPLRHVLAAGAALCWLVVAAEPAGAHAQDAEQPDVVEPAEPAFDCFGFDRETAEAAGYRVQVGTPDGDVLVGGNTTRDMLVGLGGDDLLTGAGADDIICGGEGDDILTGGDGDDRVDGGTGDDAMTMGDGDDTALGGGGDDRIQGGPGDDSIDGGRGVDHISGDDGHDYVHARGGDDLIEGGPGEDQLLGGSGDDTIGGGSGRDHLIGGRGHDDLSGDGARDRLAGGPGNDILDGDDNRDRLHGGTGHDRCDITGRDILRRCETDLTGDPIVLGVAVHDEESPEPEPDTTEQPPETTEQPPETTEPPPDEHEANDQPPADSGPVPAAEAPQGTNRFGWPLLTDVGLSALIDCESHSTHTINTGNGFYGAAQWLPNTWNAAARGAGHAEYDGVLPHLVPAEIQDEVTKWWWSATRPNTQWPHCHAHALDAMNVLAP